MDLVTLIRKHGQLVLTKKMYWQVTLSMLEGLCDFTNSSKEK